MEPTGHPNGTPTAIKRRSWDSPRLSNDVLLLVLDYLEADPDKFISLDKRQYLSQESFRPPPQPSPNQAKDVGNFRLVNKRFAELGAARQFARVTTRFSQKGFARLEEIAAQDHLAKYVKKFSYMVPYFYETGRDRVQHVLPSLPSSLGGLDVSHFEKKIYEQKTIVENKEDLRVLKQALEAFRDLKHIQILPVQDRADDLLLSYIRQHEELTQYVELKWPPACEHSTRTIGEAIIAAHGKCERFSSPMLSPQSAATLFGEPPGFGPEFPKPLRQLAEGLTSIEVHFDDGLDLDEKILDLSDLFKAVFEAAKNLQEVHVGFPTHRPLGLPLEQVFHNVRWEKLIAFGIQSWRLDAEQIIALVSRHRERLKGLRLRDVLLTEGSMWKDVLQYLRNDMRRLEWVSLRRIDYAAHFDNLMAAAGIEIQDDWMAGYESESDSSDDFDDFDDDEDGDANGNVNGNLVSQPMDVDSIGTESDGEEGHLDEDDDDDDDDDDEHGPEANGMGFPHLQPDTPTSLTWCSCDHNKNDRESAEELGDNGVCVPNATRKLWEKWVVRRCPEHNPR